jgi:hypothetical protein
MLPADICTKESGLTGKVLFGVLSILGYIVANLAWLLSLRSGVQRRPGQQHLCDAFRERRTAHWPAVLPGLKSPLPAPVQAEEGRNYCSLFPLAV